jgi:hypothetical protein
MSDHHVPPPLHLPEFDDDDAFDAADDPQAGHAYVFSPDIIREEMARNMPNPEEAWDDEHASSVSAPPSEVHEHDYNNSVSTLDIDAAATAAANGFEDSGSSLSATFSQISLDTSADEHPYHHSELTFPSDYTRTLSNDMNTGHDGIAPVDQEHGEEVPHTNGFQEVRGHKAQAEHERPTIPREPAPPSPPPHDRKRPSPSSVPLPPMPLSAPADVSKLPPPRSASSSISKDVSSPSTAPVPRGSQEGDGHSNGNGNILLTEKTFTTRRGHRSMGPSAFEKVMSKTRPTFLPPKPKEEDQKHMADWQHIMQQSRIMGGWHGLHDK